MKQVSFTLPTIERVNFKIEVLPEYLPIRGNVMASGDDEADTEEENRIIEELENGNSWAWCCIKVTASYKGLEGTDYLGGCSYADENDFINNSGYYEGMKERAFDELTNELQTLND